MKRHLRKTKKVKKGGYYSFNGALGTGAPNWTHHSEMRDGIESRAGNGMKAGRRRKHKKTRRMRGGMKWGTTAGSFVGTGSRGLADIVPTASGRTAPGDPNLGAFNNSGVQPGGGFKSFIRAH
uniref:Uncharacterized protein n=1 Tax=viral metagenome TaxID=1070528 RepID=A0A6C0JY90_9ZZZZ